MSFDVFVDNMIFVSRVFDKSVIELGFKYQKVWRERSFETLEDLEI